MASRENNLLFAHCRFLNDCSTTSPAASELNVIVCPNSLSSGNVGTRAKATAVSRKLSGRSCTYIRKRDVSVHCPGQFLLPTQAPGESSMDLHKKESGSAAETGNHSELNECLSNPPVHMNSLRNLIHLQALMEEFWGWPQELAFQMSSFWMPRLLVLKACSIVRA